MEEHKGGMLIYNNQLSDKFQEHISVLGTDDAFECALPTSLTQHRSTSGCEQATWQNTALSIPRLRETQVN